MSLIQQFLEENLSKDLNHTLLQQIQNENSAIQSLVSHLEDMRERENIEMLEAKIRRVENFIEVRKQIALSFQSLNTQGSPIFDWLLNNFIENNFLYELIKREQFLIQKQLLQIGKRIFFEENHYQQHHEDIEMAKKLIRQINILCQDKSQINKLINRQKIKDIDSGIQLFQEKIFFLQQRVADFNTQILIFLKKIYDFDQKIKSEFYIAFNTAPNVSTSNVQSNNRPQDQPISPQSFQQFEQNTPLNDTKSHLSMNSNQPQSQFNFSKTKQFARNQQTPKNYLQSKLYSTQNMKSDKNKLVLERRGLQIEKNYQNQDFRYEPFQKQRSILQQKRSSIDYKGQNSKFSQIPYQSQSHKMYKTQSSFNFNQPKTNNLLYATNQFGQQIRLPSKWVSNSRNSTVQYPAQ